jgi:biopolymer transport protein ExbB/TolQ
MNLAAMLLFFIWVSIVIFLMFAWVLMTIGNESKLIEDELVELDELDRDNIF